MHCTRGLILSCLAKRCFAPFSRSTKQQQGIIQVLFSIGPVPSGSFLVFNYWSFIFLGFLFDEGVLVKSLVLAWWRSSILMPVKQVIQTHAKACRSWWFSKLSSRIAANCSSLKPCAFFIKCGSILNWVSHEELNKIKLLKQTNKNYLVHLHC